jgi:hypothetical protein
MTSKKNTLLVIDDDDNRNSSTSKTQDSALNPFSFKNFIDTSVEISNTELINMVPDLVSSSTNHMFDSDSDGTDKNADTKGLDFSNSINFSIPEDLPSTLEDLSFQDKPKKVNSIDNLAEIREELNKKQSILNEKEAKIKLLEKRIQQLIDKEENETQTLEKVVHQVEKKLEESEKLVEIFRQENSQLKTQLKQLKRENIEFKQNAQDTEKSKNLYAIINKIAKDLNDAAQTAENSIAFLTNGVDKLKLVASNLESLEKLSQVFE